METNTMRRHKWLRLVGLLWAIAMPLAMAPSAQADRRIIIRRSPSQGEQSSQGSGRHSGGRHSGGRHSGGRHSGGRHSEDRHSEDRHSEGRHSEGRQRRSGNHRYPSRYPIYERRQPVQRRVTVEFIAQGDEWANVYVDGRRIFSPTNYANRRQRFTFREGAYDIKITGVDFFDVWAEGYLDVGRDGTNIIVVSFSEGGGIRVSGDSDAWIPVSVRR